MKKFICTVCGYVYEGDEAPEFCPQCKQPRSKFKEVVESDELDFVTEHHIGDGVVEDAEVMEGLKAHFMGECTEVGMYLAMSRQADREGYPEVAEAFKRYAWEEAEHASKFAELLGEIVWNTEKNLKARMEAESGACADKMRIAKRSKVYTIVISRNKIVFIFVRGVVHLVSYPFLSIVHYCKNRYLCAHYQINFNEKYTQFLYYCTYRPRKKYPGRSLVGVYQNHCRQRFTGSSSRQYGFGTRTGNYDQKSCNTDGIYLQG